MSDRVADVNGLEIARSILPDHGFALVTSDGWIQKGLDEEGGILSS